MEKHRIFSSSVKIWLLEFIYMIFLTFLSVITLILIEKIFNSDTLSYYNFQFKVVIDCFAYIGIILGAYKSFKKILTNKKYLSKGTKYLVALYQIIIFIGFAFICFSYKLNIVYFIGAYLTIFIQFIINTIYTNINNNCYIRYLNHMSKTKTNKENSNNNENNIIDIDKLK